MVKLIYTSLKSHLLSSVPSRLAKDEKGIAAIEFALIAPIMIAMYFGMAEVAAAISIDRQVSHSANVAGDLATQSETVSAAEMTEIMTATMMVMGIPSDKQKYVTIEIASYARAADDSIIENGKAILQGSEGKDLPSFNAADLDTRILSNSSGVVIARINYIYETLNLRYLPANIDLSEVFMLKPRKSANVDIEDPSGSTNYTCDFSGAGNTPSCNTGGTST